MQGACLACKKIIMSTAFLEHLTSRAHKKAVAQRLRTGYGYTTKTLKMLAADSSEPPPTKKTRLF